jgi:hypothetical protein
MGCFVLGAFVAICFGLLVARIRRKRAQRPSGGGDGGGRGGPPDFNINEV